ncbi:MAG: bifunctional phosphopantothenoylcysteine decarboxylase/phosphopantothenate--cysteine ligase CoaBC [Gammaproteobacteria bacterium]|jgi:phosphopantothenoylcysteine decarboxylase/phosphopantothenate--cysteine ligase
MKSLSNKHILLGITGSIAAYKAAELVRELKKAGAQVRVAMTESACEFVTPLTFQALSGNPVHTQLLDEQAEAGMGHIELARWTDALLIAPASADFIARLAQGRADDLLSAVCLACEAPIAVAPAMNKHMWSNPATQANVVTLKSRNIAIYGPAQGEQACGDVGEGRMLEAPELAELVSQRFQTGALSGKTVLVTAGPTWEAIDPVRFIANRSSGKMGFAIAQAAIEAGARAVLIAGPVQLPTPPDAQRINVRSAQQMYDAVMQHIDNCDIFISTAAVADYRPEKPASQKMKKDAVTLNIQLVKNPDILAEVARQYPQVFTVGFAAETHDVEHYAQGKLQAKSLNMIAANQVGNGELGFESEQNALSVYWHGGKQELPRTSKSHLARQLISLIAEKIA